MVRHYVRNGTLTSQMCRRRWLVYAVLAVAPWFSGCVGNDHTSSQVCSTGGFCWQRPIPQGNTLHSLSGVSGRYIWAVGEHGTILHYDGKSWSTSPSGTVEALHGVYCLGQRDAWAVGADGLALHYDGEGWHKVDSGSKETLLSTWGRGANDVWMVGRRGTLLRWDGKSIKKGGSVSESTTLFSVFGFDSSDVWITGSSGMTRHFDGTEWRAVNTSYYGDIRAAWGHRPREVWFAAGSRYSGRILRSQNGGNGEAVAPLSLIHI